MNSAIAPRLKIIIQDKYYAEESFIRNGPIRHMEDLWDDSVSSYPWSVSSADRKIIKSSVTPHLTSIRQELEDRLTKIASKEKFDAASKRHVMILIFWIVQRLRGAILKEIADSLLHFGITETSENIRKYLYCMRVAGWIGEKKYGHLSTTILDSIATLLTTRSREREMILLDLKATSRVRWLSPDLVVQNPCLTSLGGHDHGPAPRLIYRSRDVVR